MQGLAFLIPLVGVVAACFALGVSRASYYRAQKPKLAPNPRPRPARALSDQERARVLAERGKGDAAIRFELERAGVGMAELEAALASLDPEHERAAALVARRGATPATARLLAGRGFDEELVAALVAAEG